MLDYKKLRLNEIRFTNIINKYFDRSTDPIKLYDFMEFLCNLFGASETLVSSAIVDIISDPYKYRAGRMELVVLLSDTNRSVRSICRELRIGHSTYYTLLDSYQHDPYLIQPKLTEEKTVEVSKVIQGLSYLMEVIN